MPTNKREGFESVACVKCGNPFSRFLGAPVLTTVCHTCVLAIHAALPAAPVAAPEPDAPLPGTPASTISVIMQRVVQSESYGRKPIECQASELRVVLDSLEQWERLARTLQSERNAAVELAQVAERQRDTAFNAGVREVATLRERIAERDRHIIALGAELARERERADALATALEGLVLAEDLAQSSGNGNVVDKPLMIARAALAASRAEGDRT